MKLTTALIAGVAWAFGQLATAQMTPADAAAPKVSGKYALLGWNLCQAKFTTLTRDYKLANGTASGPAVQQIDPGNLGTISVEAGYVTFTPTTAGATSGQFVGSSNIINGSALKINTAGAALTQKIENFSAAYSATDTTFTLNTDVFVLSFGNVVAGVAKTINLVRKENAVCLTALSLTKQP
jgi:hypothetical protein